jgi:cell division protein FtsI/penicillin-binding protein 2
MTKLASDDVYINKALSAFPPASLFKIFVSAVALEENIVAGETAFYCGGSYSLSTGRSVGCWKEDGHGLLTFDETLAQSCNPVYVQMTLSLGMEKLRDAFDKWELDRDLLLGYPLDDHSSLNVSTENDATLANVGLGESGVMMTPLNVAKMFNVIASDGMLYTPRVVTEVYDKSGNVTSRFERAMPLRVVSKDTAEIVTDMMAETYRTGTAKNLRLDSFKLAGKTGTSETGNVWIGGFFPYDKPRFTVVVLVTDGTSGVGDAGPVMRKLCAYLGNLQ